MNAILARRAPVAKLAASLLVSVAALATRDLGALTLIVAASILLAPAFGIRIGALLRWMAPVLLAALSVVLMLSLFAADRTGTVFLHFGPILVTTSVLETSLALGLRLLALAAPAMLVFGSTDPTDLADSLVQHAKAPARFAIGALAAFRLLTLLRQEWTAITLARRARGLRRGFFRTAFVLLVGAIRRGVRLSVSMDARGFDSGLPRTVARPMPFGWADWMLIAGGAALASAALVLATWEVGVIVAFSITPLGVGEDVGKPVAEAVRVVRASGLPNRTDPMFTTIEGEWDEVMAVVKQAVDAVAAMAPRVSMVLKADFRPGVTGAMDSKVETIERILAQE